MTAERWSRVNQLFHEAAALPPTQRGGFLASACGGDAGLLAEVQSLLQHHDAPMEFLEEPVIADHLTIDPERLIADSVAEDDPLLGRTIGPYRLERRIASGGMGAVYVGARQDEFLRHAVAIKVLHPTPDAEDLRRRFQIERQTLANLNHPNVARLQDAGVTPDGLPYIIMELIDGVPIDEYCDARNLPVRERLKLFQQVCAAVHFAHQNLIVHRDLKPGNILVTADGVTKLLDFGIAKVLEPSGTEQAATRPHTIRQMLSVDYASPEQIRGEPVTTETDIYSLGVILYELLTGSRPFCITGCGFDHIVQAICVNEPRRPSTAVRTSTRTGPRPRPPSSSQSQPPPDPAAASTARRRGGATVERLARELRGDLDNIILMAMRKEPARRYGSAQQFAEDIQRYLDDHPVVARKDTLAYRARKFVQRNRLTVYAAAVLLVGLLAATAMVMAQARIAADERDAARLAEQAAEDEAHHARIEAASAGQVAEFLVEAFVDLQAGGDDPAGLEAARNRLGRHAARVRRQYAGEPHLRANLLDALGRVHMHVHDHDQARSLMIEAAEIRRDTFGERSLEYALSLNSQGELAHQQADYARAAELFAAALTLHESLEDGVHTDVALACNNFAVALRALGQIDEAERLHQRALRLRRAQHGARSPLAAESLNNLAGIDLARGEYARAQARLREALAIRRETLGDEHPLVAQNLSNLATAHFQDGQLDAAEPLLREAIELYASTPGAAAHEHARALRNLAEVRRARGDVDEAGQLLDRALASLEALYRSPHPHVAGVLESLATLDEARGDQAAALERWGQAVDIYARTLPPEHPMQAGALNGYGRLLTKSGRAEEAFELLERAQRMYEARHSAAHPSAAIVKANLGSCLVSLARYDRAEPLLKEAYEQLRAHHGEDSKEAAAARDHLIRLYRATGRDNLANALDNAASPSPP